MALIVKQGENIKDKPVKNGYWAFSVDYSIVLFGQDTISLRKFSITKYQHHLVR